MTCPTETRKISDMADITSIAIRYLNEMFDSSNLDEAEHLLSHITPNANRERCQCAAIRFSSGRLDRLRIAVDLAATDFRDLLMAAGFGDLESHKHWKPRRITPEIIHLWQQGLLLPDVAFELNEKVYKLSSVQRRKIKSGVILSLLLLEPRPCYLVRFDSDHETETWQSELAK